MKGALFIGMIITGIIAYFADMLSFSGGIMSVPAGRHSGMEPDYRASDVIRHGLYAVVFSFLLVTLFDTTGTVGVAEQAGLMKDNKRLVQNVPCSPIRWQPWPDPWSGQARPPLMLNLRPALAQAVGLD